MVRTWDPPSHDELRSARTVAELQALSRRRTMAGFNGQFLRARYLLHLFEASGCTSFLETGTWHGATALTARRLFRRPAWTVELVWRVHMFARLAARLTRTNGITFVRGDSRKALATWLQSAQIGSTPMAYLDAHWFHDHPLRREVELALERGRCIVVIDDCRVEADPGFGFDQQDFGPDSAFNFTVALPSFGPLPAERVIALQPAHRAADETGLRRGCTVLLIDVPLPAAEDESGRLFAPVPLQNAHAP